MAGGGLETGSVESEAHPVHSMEIFTGRTVKSNLDLGTRGVVDLRISLSPDVIAIKNPLPAHIAVRSRQVHNIITIRPLAPPKVTIASVGRVVDIVVAPVRIGLGVVQFPGTIVVSYLVGPYGNPDVKVS